MGRSGSEGCGQAVDILRQVLEELGIPVALDKLEGPVDCLTFLGFELDTVAREVPRDLESVKTRKVCGTRYGDNSHRK